LVVYIIFINDAQSSKCKIFVLRHVRSQIDYFTKGCARSSLLRFVSNFVRIKTFWQNQMTEAVTPHIQTLQANSTEKFSLFLTTIFCP